MSRHFHDTLYDENVDQEKPVDDEDLEPDVGTNDETNTEVDEHDVGLTKHVEHKSREKFGGHYHKGEKVKDENGNIYTVVAQKGVRVIVEGDKWFSVTEIQHVTASSSADHSFINVRQSLLDVDSSVNALFISVKGIGLSDKLFHQLEQFDKIWTRLHNEINAEIHKEA